MTLPIFLLAMAAMMLPSELAYFRLDYATARSRSERRRSQSATWPSGTALAAPLFFLPAPPWEIAVAVAVAYQLTPFKRRCLSVCRAPFARIVAQLERTVSSARSARASATACRCAGCCAGATLALLAVGHHELSVDGARGAPHLRREASNGAMGDLSYRVRGAYFESCNCEAICPCRKIGGVPGGRSTYGELLRRPLLGDRDGTVGRHRGRAASPSRSSASTTTTKRGRRGRSSSTSTTTATGSRARRSSGSSSTGCTSCRGSARRGI